MAKFIITLFFQVVFTFFSAYVAFDIYEVYIARFFDWQQINYFVFLGLVFIKQTVSIKMSKPSEDGDEYPLYIIYPTHAGVLLIIWGVARLISLFVF
jgi:hypothetical protein